MALVAVAALASALPRGALHRATPVESRLSMSEAETVRAVAAAVAAAARELAGADRINAALPAQLLIDERNVSLRDANRALLNDPIVLPCMIAERLLDLPPPQG